MFFLKSKPMLIAATHTRIPRRSGVTVSVCWKCQANFDGQGIVGDAKGEPQPKGETPGA